MRSLIERVPPHDADAEQYVLSCCLASNALGTNGRDMAAHALAKLQAGDFYQEAHRHIFGAIETLHQKGAPVELMGVKDLTIGRGLDVAYDYLIDLAGAVPSLAPFDYYADKLANLGRRRRAIRLMAESIEKAYDLDVPDPIAEAQAGLLHLAASSPEADDWKSLEELDAINYAKMEAEKEARDAGKVTQVIEFGYHDLDNILAVTDGDLLILAARTGFGKTALAMNFARKVAANKRLVGVFSLEVNKENIARRDLAGRTGISVVDQMRGNIKGGQWDAISAAMKHNKGLRIEVRDKARTTIPDMLAACRRLEAKRGQKMGLVIVDYLTLVEAHTKTNNETERASKISRELKLLAGELRCPVLALAQFNRGVDNREGQRPELRDLKQSGSIEQDASVAMFIHRPGHKDGEPLQNGPVELIVAKNRNGPTRTVELYFNATQMTFTDVGYIPPTYATKDGYEV